MSPRSILTSRRQGWAAAISVSRSPWAKTADGIAAASKVRGFMRGCGIDLPATGAYSAGVARFVRTFQECLILAGTDNAGAFDYRAAPLSVDGIAGPQTLRAIRRSTAAGHKVWEHLKWSEIRVHDPAGRRPTFLNPVIYTTRDTVELYARMRDRVGGPLPVRSWWRSPRWNSIVGGATKSQHLLGVAIDFDPTPELTEAVLRELIAEVQGRRGGGVGVVERWTRRGGRWAERVEIVGPAHVDLRAGSARWSYKTG